MIKMYQDGEFVAEKSIEGIDLNNHKNLSNFYLGVSDPNKKTNKNFFNGLVSNFCVFNNVLNDKEIVEISSNNFLGLTQNFGDYVSCGNIQVYYDAKFIKDYKLIDLSGNDNNGQIYNCEIVPNLFENITKISVPHRRKSLFSLIPHDENGFVESSWKDITTRYNQLKFYNEVSKGYKNTFEDGLSNCKFKELSHSSISNQTHVTVSI
jgi:hypothetical protein